MHGSAVLRARPAWWSLLLIAVLGALVIAAPAFAGERQSADISQTCNAGGSGDSEDSESDKSSSSKSGDCGNQRRVVQQRAGGTATRSVNQTQTFGGERRSNSDDDNNDDDGDDDTEGSASVSAQSTDCEDFSSQGDAQAALEDGSGDTAELDGDDDGRACEAEFTQAVSGAPEGGVETGGGGTLARTETGSDPLARAAKVAGPPLALALIVVGLLGLRRERAA